MATACDSATLINTAQCLKCIPIGMQKEVLIYLLAQIAEVDATPASLIEASKCFKCIPTGMQDEVIAYLLCQIVNA